MSATQTKVYAVAASTDAAREYPDLKELVWIPMKTKSVNFVNMVQVHFQEQQQAEKIYDSIKSKGLLVFKNWRA